MKKKFGYSLLSAFLTLVLVMTLSLSSSPALAQSYSNLPSVRLFEDPGKNLSFQKVLSQYQAGAGRVPDGNRIFLGHTVSAYWMLFTAENQNPAKNHWVLNLGTREEGTSGTADRLAFFSDESPDQPLLIDGRHVRNKLQMQSQEKNALPLTLDPGKKRIFALYIEPTRGIPLVMTPHLEEQTTYQAARDSLNFKNNSLAVLLIVFMGVLLFFVIENKNSIYWLLMVYTASQFLIYRNTDEIISLGNNTGIIYLDVLYAMAAIAALLLTQQVLVRRDAEQPSRLIPIVAVVIALLTATGFATDAIGDITAHILLRFTPIALPAFISTLLLMAIPRQDVPQVWLYALSWLTLLAGALLVEIGADGLISSAFLSPNFYWLCFMPHILLLSIASLRFISVTEKLRRQHLAEEALRLEDEMEFRKTRELSDQSRLLGVLQREKELITDLRNREAERIQALRQAKEAAEDANKAKTEFLAIISHEIRTPMTGIMGMIRMLMDTQLDAKQKEHASTLKYAGEALLALLNDILDFSKASAGKIELESINFDLGRLVESVVLLISGRAEEKKISLKHDIAPGTPLLLKGDPTRLRQILLNLITNAVKFTEKGSVTLIVKMQDNVGHKPKIYFAVKDTGIGIPKDAQKSIFTPYTQANSSISRRFGGTGLGLSICQRLVTAMGGDILIDSELGVGTTFYFTVPFDEGTVEVETVATEGTVAVKPLKILVVDDNPINQKVVAGLLDKDKHTLIAAGGAIDALNELKKSSFDVILMDMEMPQIDGPKATRMIRALENKEKAMTPVIAMTANSMKEDIDRCLAAGMNDYCSKPIDLERLRELLMQVANKEGAFKPVPIKKAPAVVVVAPPPASAAPLTLAGAHAPAAPVAAPPPPENTFNPEVVNSLKKSMAPAEFEDMMNGLYEKTEELITAAEKAIVEKNIKALAGRGHDIYGMTANFGLNAISEPAHQLDRQAKENAPIETLAAIVIQLRPAYEATRKAIAAWAKA